VAKLVHERMTAVAPDPLPLRRVLAEEPQTAIAWQRLGLVIAAAGDVDSALTPLRRATMAGPRLLAPWESLGLAFGVLGRWSEAAVAYRTAFTLRTDRADVAAKLAEALARAGLPGEAATVLDAAVSLSPADQRLRHDRAMMRAGIGEFEAASRDLRAVVAAEAGSARAWYALGQCAMRLTDMEGAARRFQRSLAIEGNGFEPLANLGVICQRQLDFALARRSFRRAIALMPAIPETHNNLGAADLVLGRVGSAIRGSRRAVTLAPDWTDAHSNLLLTLAYRDMDDGRYFLEHRRWETLHAAAGYSRIRPHANDPDPERRLRIGYLSADLFNHPLGTNVAGLIAHHDRREVEVRCYAEIGRADEMTRHIKALADDFVETQDLDDAALAERIRADGVDILVVLAGHTARNRLAASAAKPAPIMVSHCNFSTTGLAVMDYWLSDAILHPPGATTERFTERLMRLPMMMLHRPIEVAPAVSTLPAPERGHVTFGSFNNPAKIGPEVVALWARLLSRVPGSRLILKYRTVFEIPDVQRRLIGAFGAHGIEASRIVFAGGDLPRGQHLALVGEVDIALDPFPFNGCTTTFEALWMGVPVVTLAGRRFLGRMGASFITHVGLPELVAADADAYLGIAAGLAADPERLAALRAGLRERVLASPLCDAQRYARSVDVAFRAAWREWCAGRR
jgi:protein O-GlcNAc transferase